MTNCNSFWNIFFFIFYLKKRTDDLIMNLTQLLEQTKKKFKPGSRPLISLIQYLYLMFATIWPSPVYVIADECKRVFNCGSKHDNNDITRRRSSKQTHTGLKNSSQRASSSSMATPKYFLSSCVCVCVCVCEREREREREMEGVWTLADESAYA